MSSRTVAVAAAVMAAIWAAAGGVSVAGTLEPPGPPSSTNSAMYTLQDVYNRLTTGATTNKRTGAFTEPTSGPTSGTMRTVDEIYAVAIPTQVRKTGQTTAYDTNTPKRDDGALQKGVALPSPRFTDNGNGTVTDNATGLIWLKNANVSGSATWQTALNWVVELNTNGTMNGINAGDTSNGGSHQTDWRLPTSWELASLVVHKYATPALCNTAGTGQLTAGDPFTNVLGGSFISSTTYAGNTANAWYVGVAGDGGVRGSDGTKNQPWWSVWPVRGGQ